MADSPVAAVIVQRAYKYYGKQDKADYKPVLKHLDMTVEKGIIYGLLGPSGCGKTTLLSCIVGRRNLDSGEVWVLGGRPGEKGSGVPGPRVGYMPQEIALVGELSVRAAVYYFGRIYGMNEKKLRERFEFLSDLLELPGGGRLVKSLSGGQQRRVSLAAALVHEPELLILDEPTVGLDPVLRERSISKGGGFPWSVISRTDTDQRTLNNGTAMFSVRWSVSVRDITVHGKPPIWEFLTKLAQAGTTVIITTHYIDETKQAHKIGMLRDGQLLAEDSPEEILRQFDCDTLEDAFLKLALRQHEIQPRRRSTLTGSPDVIPNSALPERDNRFQSREDFNMVTSSTDVLTKKEKPISTKGLSKARYKAVFFKNMQQFARHPGGLIFSILFPILEIVAFFSAVGHDPKDLKVGVVNEEAGFHSMGWEACKNSSNIQVIKLEDETCEYHMLSCMYLEEMEKFKLHQVPFNSTIEAKDAVYHGSMYGALYFTRNFSEALSLRILEGHAADDVVMDSTVSVWLDMTNHQISYFLKSQLLKAYETFTRRAMRACGRPENMIQMPVHFQEPIYGSKDSEIVFFMAPGIMITIIFFLAAIVTSTLMIDDRLEGVWERSAVAGVKPSEMLHVHILIQTIVILFQTIEMIALSFFGYGLPSRGSLITCGCLLFLQGLSGMCYGFLLSICCPSYSLAFFVATGSFYPMILLCGILWPLEGMSKGLRMIALTLPFTIPSLSLRDIMEKGYTILDPGVYQGFLTTVAWIAITLTLCLLCLRYKKT